MVSSLSQLSHLEPSLSQIAGVGVWRMPPRKKYVGSWARAITRAASATKTTRALDLFRPAAKYRYEGKQICPNADCQYWAGNRDKEQEKVRAAEGGSEDEAAADRLQLLQLLQLLQNPEGVLGSSSALLAPSTRLAFGRSVLGFCRWMGCCDVRVGRAVRARPCPSVPPPLSPELIFLVKAPRLPVFRDLLPAAP